MRAANHAWACDGMEEGTPSRSILLTPPPASHQVFLTSWQGFRCRQDPRSCCLLNVWAYSQYFCGNFFFLGALPQQGREE